MPETLPATLPTPPAEAMTGHTDRDAVIRELLPYDYDFAKEKGLIDMFYYDPNTGEDGLMHTLGGNLRTAPTGAFVAEGFHHEPSAEAVWPTVTTKNGAQLVTRVDRSHLETANSQERAKYREFPLEPYQGQVVINGLRKMAAHRDEVTGETKLVPAKNTMFPSEYDALVVMQSVKSAYETRDRTKEIRSKNVDGKDVIVAQGNATLLDGKSQMPIRLILDAETEKVMSAIPVTKRKPGIMKLTKEAADQLIYGR